MKKILIITALVLSIATTSVFSNKTEEKALDKATPTPYIVTDPTGGGI